MAVEIRKKGICITQCNALEEKEHVNVINNPCKSKRNLRGFVESHVCHLVWNGVIFDPINAV
jgi:hypothetical protein